MKKIRRRFTTLFTKAWTRITLQHKLKRKLQFPGKRSLMSTYPQAGDTDSAQHLFLSIYLWLYSPLLDLGRFFSFLFVLYSRYDSSDGGSARRKAATWCRPIHKRGIETQPNICFCLSIYGSTAPCWTYPQAGDTDSAQHLLRRLTQVKHTVAYRPVARQRL
jgi:hypothetical protein